MGGIGLALARELGQRTGFEVRVTVLGHVQRGGSPNEFDRVLATRYGYHAAELVIAGNFGRMVSLQGTEMTSIPLKWVEGVKTVDLQYLEMARTFF
jgi:6-phosphofructokinase 1